MKIGAQRPKGGRRGLRGVLIGSGGMVVRKIEERYYPVPAMRLTPIEIIEEQQVKYYQEMKPWYSEPSIQALSWDAASIKHAHPTFINTRVWRGFTNHTVDRYVRMTLQWVSGLLNRSGSTITTEHNLTQWMHTLGFEWSCHPRKYPLDVVSNLCV